MKKFGQPISYEDARAIVYGEPYSDWKKKYQVYFHCSSTMISSLLMPNLVTHVMQTPASPEKMEEMQRAHVRATAVLTFVFG